ncbi:MAG TPA: patatin-like phospholipase family protein [Acidobacteriota bacterium]|nr:patatin-like phospholipase family protein [Acidobacteriota bacterium]
MSAPLTAVVLTGGGARGAYQAGVLAGIADRSRCDVCFPIVTGVSAGGINAAALAASRASFAGATEELRQAWLKLTTDSVFRSNFRTLTWSAFRWIAKVGSGGAIPADLRGLLDTRPLRTYLETAIDFDGIGDNIAGGRLHALALSMTEYATGRTVTAVQATERMRDWQRARRLSERSRITVDHVMASAALPVVFPAIQIGGDYYGDGSIRQSAPLSPAVHLGADRILAISVRYSLAPKETVEPQFVGYPPPAQILGMILHGVFIDDLEDDAERLLRINRTLQAVPQGAELRDDLRPIDMLMLRPSRDLGKLSAGLVDELPRPLRLLARGLGASRTTTPDFLSYLLFEQPYIERLMDLGFEDVRAQWDTIEPFLSG